MVEQDPEQLADALESEAERLERHSHELQERVDAARQAWEHKRRDESVPGAPQPGAQADEAAAADEKPQPDEVVAADEEPG
ncbi:MAG TPA: hypothetical protein VGI50_08415 [Solirubrobacteraceae bacterium]|jgi:hypothetical protein